mmetsp:Transcript_1958/g.3754  ORF Transcript_1958/g.3754 Transcript_1958/m.3754 type:complete len:276 (-) Transcript_1958:238-1065(-)
MSRQLVLLILLSATALIQAVPFHLVTPPLFGIPRASDGTPTTSCGDDAGQVTDEEFQQCEQATIHALELAKDRIVHAVQDEVNIMFPHETAHRHVVKTVNRKVPDNSQHQSTMDLSQVQFSHDDPHRPYPYDIKGALDKEKEEHNVAHAAEAVEKAVVHAIEQEVDTFFPPSKDTADLAKKNNKKRKKSLDKEAHRVAHTAEAVEKAVVHAIENEVDTLFPPSSQTKPVVAQESIKNNKKNRKATSKKSNVNTKQNEDHRAQLQSLEEFLEFTDE